MSVNELPPHEKDVLCFLRNKARFLLTEEIITGKRLEVFHGNDALDAIPDALLSKHSLPADKNQKREILQALTEAGFFIRVEKGKKKSFKPASSRKFTGDAHYAWIYEGSRFYEHLFSFLILFAVLLFVMIPLWPARLRKLVWYVFPTLGVFAAAIFAIAVVRILVFSATMLLLPPGVWLFPNLFADCGVVESFLPLWEWDGAESSEEEEKKTK
ncbi:MAG: preprotein translocase subunit Sec62 [Amphiamblys sp. WSBS2006]|nr:MAG: preprotein translocase subunit Sec62 [Amphiamblys sp. WSBS2006]